MYPLFVNAGTETIEDQSTSFRVGATITFPANTGLEQNVNRSHTVTVDLELSEQVRIGCGWETTLKLQDVYISNIGVELDIQDDFSSNNYFSTSGYSGTQILNGVLACDGNLKELSCD